jgi:hypothetical protein
MIFHHDAIEIVPISSPFASFDHLLPPLCNLAYQAVVIVMIRAMIDFSRSCLLPVLLIAKGNWVVNFSFLCLDRPPLAKILYILPVGFQIRLLLKDRIR